MKTTHGMTASKPAPPKPAGPGPKPSQPTGPPKTAGGPPRGNGHALPAIDSDPRPGATDRRASGGGVVAARGSDHLPQMCDQLASAINKLVQASYDIERECDPTSAPDDDTPVHQLIFAIAHDHIDEALGLLGELAARFPDRATAPPTQTRAVG